jgi:hypothetical protein
LQKRSSDNRKLLRVLQVMLLAVVVLAVGVVSVLLVSEAGGGWCLCLDSACSFSIHFFLNGIDLLHGTQGIKNSANNFALFKRWGRIGQAARYEHDRW